MLSPFWNILCCDILTEEINSLPYLVDYFQIQSVTIINGPFPSQLFVYLMQQMSFLAYKQYLKLTISGNVLAELKTEFLPNIVVVYKTKNRIYSSAFVINLR